TSARMAFIAPAISRVASADKSVGVLSALGRRSFASFDRIRLVTVFINFSLVQRWKWSAFSWNLLRYGNVNKNHRPISRSHLGSFDTATQKRRTWQFNHNRTSRWPTNGTIFTLDAFHDAEIANHDFGVHFPQQRLG